MNLSRGKVTWIYRCKRSTVVQLGVPQPWSHLSDLIILPIFFVLDRVQNAGYSVSRPEGDTGKYKSIPHHHRGEVQFLGRLVQFVYSSYKSPVFPGSSSIAVPGLATHPFQGLVQTAVWEFLFITHWSVRQVFGGKMILLVKNVIVRSFKEITSP